MYTLMEKIAASKPKVLTLHEKVDKLTKTIDKTSKAAKAAKATVKVHKPIKLGLVDAGMAGASSLVNKVRQERQEGY